MTLLEKLSARFRRPSSPAEAARARARRQKALLAKGAVLLPYVQLLLAIAGIVQLLAIPLPIQQLLKKSFIDENAFQPGQVNTYFSWSDVSAADRYAEALQHYQNVTDGLPRSRYIVGSLQEQGLSAFIQEYAKPSQTGYNAYARLHAPKTSGSEVIVLCAPWLSRQKGMVNIRGIATLLALAKHVQRLSMWSKDIILLFSDGDLDGAQTWLRAYHGSANAHIAPLTAGSGNIWGSIIVDYPYHSFSHLGLYYEGVNGRLLNLDVVHGAAHIARWVGGVPVRLHNQSFSEFPAGSSTAQVVPHYQQRAKGIVEQVFNTMTTLPTGAEGLFSQYGVETIGFFAVPAEGPHGFFDLGRIIESMSRAFNNLTERLHASFFLYLLPEPFQFLSVATYLSAPILLAASLTIAGLRLWRKSEVRAGLSLCISILFSYILGCSMLFADRLGCANIYVKGLLTASILIISLTRFPKWTNSLAIQCLLCGMLISVSAILNYGLGVGLALLGGVPSLLAVYKPPKLGGMSSRAVSGGLLASLAGGTVEQYCKYRDAFDDIHAIAPLMLYVGLVPLWLQLAFVL